MNKERITDDVEKLINDEVSQLSMEYASDDSARDRFCLSTVDRLVKAYALYKKNNLYTEDYLLALRDYLLFFDVSIEIRQDDFLNNNEFGISFDYVNHRYFASIQMPCGINAKFVRDAFLRNEQTKKTKRNENLVTDSMIYSLTGYSVFKSLDQKIAVYGALNTPDGFTTLVSLPTGGGKSLVTQTISYQKEGLTIIIVPTVSLAIDQERVSKAAIRRDSIEDEIFSYSSGVDAGPILSAIKEKKARMLFISPEALLENPLFADAIKIANKGRYLKNIVIDEAHIVVDWGAAFRVDYQCLEAWRNTLLLSNPSLRTILLSATFEDKCVDILKDFFEVNERWIEIRCDALRHEPRYSVVRAKNYNEKQKNIVELVRKLPHPMIIYVARPADANSIRKTLSNAGINNVRTFTGLTGKGQRKKLIDGWVDNQFEIMVATSAFGVGVDKPDVRTVIHTYIPQNANTYYQELGRGGRDHLPCLSVMCLQPEDTTIGRDRIKKKVLTADKIIRRWDRLYNNIKSIRMSGNRVFIDTAIKPNYADADEFEDAPANDADMNWNVYVILFLRRYNMIQILEIKIDQGRYMILIKIDDDRLLTINEELTEYIKKIREEEWNYYSSAYKTISYAVRPNYRECISELFTDAYSKVFEYCAGCNVHEEPIIGDTPRFPLKNRVSAPLKSISAEQDMPFGTANEMMVIADETEQTALLDRLIGKGVSMVIVPDHFKRQDMLLSLNDSKNTMIFGLEELHQFIKMKGYYFTSGLVAVIYPKDENEFGKQYVIVKNNLCGRESTKVIHIVEANAYVASAGKTLFELVNGPSSKANIVYV